MPAVVYSRQVNLGVPGMERLHPFDGHKYARAWALLKEKLGLRLEAAAVEIDRPISDAELTRVHTPEYLARLKERDVVAEALEISALRHLPYALLNTAVLEPMRWAVRGSILAAREAFKVGLAVNLGGGFHHAKPDRGEGFCLLNDIALLVQQSRDDGALDGKRVVVIDLDAHQGNGVSHCFAEDRDVFLFDMFNAHVYPSQDRIARDRVDCAVPLDWGCRGHEYLRLLQEKLPGFLDSVGRTKPIGLAICNAGTDVFAGDELGCLELSADDVLKRDLFTINELRRRQIPTVFLTSGGYTQESHRLIAATVEHLLT